MTALAPCYRWWRYSVKAPRRKPYPVRRFTAAECEAYVLGKCRGRYDKPMEMFGETRRGYRTEGYKSAEEKSRAAAILERVRLRRQRRLYFWRDGIRRSWKQLSGGWGERLRIPGTWRFLGYGRHYSERWAFTPKKTRKARRVFPSFHDAGFVVRDWRPDRQHFFGAWEQQRYVHRTRLPIPRMTDISPFLVAKLFPLHRVESNQTKGDRNG